MSLTHTISTQLDAFSQTEGAVLVRGPDGWFALEPENPGLVLVIQPDGNPAWSSATEMVYKDSGWIDLPLTSQWDNIGGIWQTARYRRNGAGLVSIQGYVRPAPGGGANPVAVLPDGFRPDNALRFGIEGNQLDQLVDVHADGRVNVRNTQSSQHLISLCWQLT